MARGVALQTHSVQVCANGTRSWPAARPEDLTHRGQPPGRLRSSTMTRSLVAAHYVWDEYPGLRIGKLVSGQGDLGQHPRGETHAVAGPDAVSTVCGRPRVDFEHDFAASVSLRDAEPCESCGVRAP